MSAIFLLIFIIAYYVAVLFTLVNLHDVYFSNRVAFGAFAMQAWGISTVLVLIYLGYV